MKIIDSLDSVGQYAVLMKSTLTLPDRFREFWKEFFKEMYKLGVNSLWIVMIISFFIGAVMVVQIALNVASPLCLDSQWVLYPERLYFWSFHPQSCV